MRQCAKPLKWALPMGIAFTFLAKAGNAEAVDGVDWIDPLIGAVTYPDESHQGRTSGNGIIHGCGKTFPGAATPFGQVQLSPDTVTGGDNGSGYSYAMSSIEGFSFTHMSGVGWYGEFGNLQVMPTTGLRELDRERASSPFSHERETAKAGYYRVELDRYGVGVELTASKTCGFMRFAFPQDETARVKFDLGRRIGQKDPWLSNSEQRVVAKDSRTIAGYMVCSAKDGGWGRGKGDVNYTLYFYAEFSEPMVMCGVAEKGREVPCGKAVDYTGTNVVFFAEFGRLSRSLELKVGISFDSEECARNNFVGEASGTTFDEARIRARNLWSDAMGSLCTKGGTANDRTVFYSALYHAMIDPREIGRGDGFVRRTVFSGWDVFRSEMPLLTLIRPDVVSDTIKSMMETVTSGKREVLPRWDIFGCSSGCMIGQPVISVMADAYEKGIRDFDVELALKLADAALEGESDGRRRGFYPGDLSRTLEYAYFDWCYGRLAELAGHTEDARRGYAYGQNYTNCWSREVGWMRARKEDGSWLEWLGRERHGQGCIESNPWQQGWFVPHDVEGLVRLMGGRRRFTEELERFFNATPADFGWCDSYNHPNETCHLLPFLFAHSEKPELVSRWTRAIRENAYGTGPYGLCGNDDVGQMSAWYVLAAIGIHPLCPGDGRWYITAPLFDETKIRLSPRYYPGGTFTIKAKSLHGTRDHVLNARLNGKPLDRLYITTAELAAGGILEVGL